MKFTIEMNVYELSRSITEGTLQALCRDAQAAEQDARKVNMSTPISMKETVEKKADKPTKEAKVAPAAEEKETTEQATTKQPDNMSAEVEEPSFTLEEVRAKLAALSQAGKQAQVKALIAKFGASKLTDVPKDKYAELMKEAGEL
jgi:hypothetical protein